MFVNDFFIPNREGSCDIDTQHPVSPPHHDHHHHFPHPPKPAFTMQEEFMRTIQRVNEALHRVLEFEKHVSNVVETFKQNLSADNVTFKNLCTDTYNRFSRAVTDEINSFETSITNSYGAFDKSYADFRESINAKIAEFVGNITHSFEEFKTTFSAEMNEHFNAHRDEVELRIVAYNQNHEEAFNEFSSDMNQRFTATVNELNTAFAGFQRETNNAVSAFKTAVENRLDSQDSTIADAVHFFKTNANSSVALLLAQMKANGELNAFTWATPEMFGAVGDGVTDDTDAINRALIGSKYLVFTNQYAIRTSESDDEYGHEGLGIAPQSNSTLHFVNGSKLIGIKNNAKRYAVIRCKDVENVRILNAVIECDRTLEDGQHGFGITIRNCENVVVEGAKIYNALGDGIVIGTYQDAMEDNAHNSRNITVRNCEIFNNRRQGITIGGVDGVLIEDCYIHHINGTLPQAGIDIEPNFATILSNNIIIRNCRFENNGGYDVTHTNGCSTTPTIIEGCKMYDLFLGTGEYVLRNCDTHTITVSSTTSSATIRDCTLNNIVANSHTVLYNCVIEGDDFQNTICGESVEFFCCKLSKVRSVYMGTDGTALFDGCKISDPHPESKFSNKGRLTFRNCSLNLGSIKQSLTATTIDIVGCVVNYEGEILSTTTEANHVGLICNNIFNTGTNCMIYPKNSTFANNVCAFASNKIMSATGIVQGNIHLSE